MFIYRKLETAAFGVAKFTVGNTFTSMSGNLIAEPLIPPKVFRSGVWACRHCRAEAEKQKNPDGSITQPLWPLPVESLFAHFNGAKIPCPKCNKEHLLLKLIESIFLQEYNPSTSFGVLGAMTSHFRIPVEKFRTSILDTSKFGIPRSATIVDVTVVGNGMYCNRVQTSARFVNDPWNVTVYASPSRSGDLEEAQAMINVTWIPESSEDSQIQSLIRAIEAHLRREYSSAIISSNVAVESAVYSLIDLELSQLELGKKRIKDFLEGAATYSYQLNVLLPLVSQFRNWPQIGKEFLDQLNALKKARNDIAHRGIARSPLTKEKMASYLAHSIIAWQFLNALKNVDRT